LGFTGSPQFKQQMLGQCALPEISPIQILNSFLNFKFIIHEHRTFEEVCWKMALLHIDENIV